MTTGGEPAPLSAASPKRRRGRWILIGGGVVLLAVAMVAFFAWRQVDKSLDPQYRTVAYDVPSAPRLAAEASGEHVYRINPRQSSLTYSIQEKLFGHSASTATGSTQGIAGDIALNSEIPAASRFGTIVVDVSQLHSDNNLRDARIRADYLESAKYPLIKLDQATVRDLAGPLQPGQEYEFGIDTVATVKGRQVPLSWQATGTLEDGQLVATATTNAKLSDMGVGPISVAGLVSTSDDIQLTLKITAQDPATRDIPQTIAAPAGAERAGGGPSFKEAVQPILESSCASCHQPGEVGAHQWTLETAKDAAAVADGIGAVVANGYMPPWPASDAGVALAHSKQLSAEQVKTITAWAKSGGALDVPKSTVIGAVQPPKGTQPRADVKLEMPQPYVGTGTQDNDYRCFLLDPHITKPTYMRGFQVYPDKREQVHHVQIFHTDATQAARAASFSGKDGRPGWECFGTGSLGAPGSREGNRTDTGGFKRRPNFSNQAGLIAGWVPGQDPVLFPDNSGILFLPGDQIVYQVHYHFAHTPQPDQSSVTMQLDPATPDIKPIDIVNPLAPVEIPCPAGVTAPLCDRSAAIAAVEQQYGRFGSTIANGLHFLCGTSVDQLAALTKDGISHSTCTVSVPEDGRIVSVFGHEHTLGKAFRLTLDPGLKSQKVLLDIPNWNFNWQMNYELAKPIHVKAGQKIKMDCSWDRAADPNRAPRYIVFAEGTEDEMCFGTYSIIPDKY